MADDPHNTSDISDLAEPSAAKEDAETTAARRELKQTSISEKAGGNMVPLSQDDKSASDDDAPNDKAAPHRITPEINLRAAKQDALKEQLSSPKKKRAHDELDENRDVTEAPLAAGPSGEAASAPSSQSRTQRSEPEKKRPRDRQASASAVRSGKEEVEPLSASASPRSSMEQPSEARDSTGSTAATTTDKPQTSATAFASSGFAKLAAASSSPFGALGGSGKPSLFGSTSGSSFLGGSKPAAPVAPPKLSFGSGAAASPFAGLNGQSSGSVFKSSPFGSAFGGSSLSGPRLSNFGKPGETLPSKPAKPFGAPDSDEEKSEEEDNEDEDTKNDAASDDGEAKEEEREKDDKAADDKKKPKLHKIVVDDGEGREITIFSARAKMYVMEKGVGWKERGGGMLKVNVPRSTVEIDDNGVPDPSSFDISELDDEDEAEGRKHVRLIMRQDHTLRVILNTIILPAMTFQVTHKLKAATVLFTAFESGEARQVQMKLSEANATAFSQLVEMLKKQLADV